MAWSREIAMRLRSALVLLAAAAALVTSACRRACCPCPCPCPGRSAPLPPAPPVPAAETSPPARVAAAPEADWKKHELEVLEATMLFAGAKAEAQRSAPDMQLARRTIEAALASLPPADPPSRVGRFRAKLTEALERLPKEAPAAAPGEPAKDAALEVQIHAVSDLLKAMEALPFPRIQLVGPDTVVEEPRDTRLPYLLFEQLPDALLGPTPPEMRLAGSHTGAAPSSLVVKGTAEQQKAVAAVLTSLREIWPLLWPDAFPAEAQPAR